jgi:co-chaperonin GroES (HSP10)
MPRRATALRAVDIADQAAEHFSDPANEGKIFIPNTQHSVARMNTVGFQYDSLEDAFPAVDPRERPAGNLVLFQLRRPKEKTEGGIIIIADARQTELDNNQVGKVIAIGPLAFHNRNTNEEWPEGAWAKVGDYVRIPKYQGDRFIRYYVRKDGETETRDEVHFVYMKDLAIISLLDDPMAVRSYL